MHISGIKVVFWVVMFLILMRLIDIVILIKDKGLKHENIKSICV